MAAYPHALENKYPRVFAKIMSMWDSPAIDQYFLSLVVDDRGGRAGFPSDVAAEIVHLSLIHAAHHATFQKNDVWDISSNFASFSTDVTPEQIQAWVDPPLHIRTNIEKLGGRCTQEGFLQAAESGQRAIVGFFLEAKTNTEIRNERGWTALMLASYYSHFDMVDLLLDHGASVFSCDAGGNTALHWAAFSNCVECVRLLIEHHADIDARNSFGWTPLFQSTTLRHLEVVLLLVSRGANLDIPSKEGDTPLHKAAGAGYVEIVRPLLANNADTSIKNVKGETAVKLAIRNRQQEVINLLLSGKAQV